MTIDELRAAALAAAIDENETTGWYLRWDAGVAAFRWEVAFTAVEERPEWADGSWPTVQEAIDAAQVACGYLMESILYANGGTYFLLDWDGLSSDLSASQFGASRYTLTVCQIVKVRAEDLSDHFEGGEE